MLYDLSTSTTRATNTETNMRKFLTWPVTYIEVEDPFEGTLADILYLA